MVDIHCHILPQVDDGAKSWEVSLEMCRMAAGDGITHMVATPHANEVYSYNREQHASVLEQLRTRLAGPPDISLGCDFHFSYENMLQVLSNPAQYTIGNTRYLLVELSDYSIPRGFPEHLDQLMAAGLRPVITHPERNPLLQSRPEQLLDWASQGAIMQVTANSLTAHWGRTAQRVARWLLDHHAVHVIASDAHDLDHRPPLLSPAYRTLCKWKDEAVALALLEQNPGAIVRDEDLPYFPQPER